MNKVHCIIFNYRMSWKSTLTSSTSSSSSSGTAWLKVKVTAHKDTSTRNVVCFSDSWTILKGKSAVRPQEWRNAVRKKPSSLWRKISWKKKTFTLFCSGLFGWKWEPLVFRSPRAPMSSVRLVSVCGWNGAKLLNFSDRRMFTFFKRS